MGLATRKFGDNFAAFTDEVLGASEPDEFDFAIDVFDYSDFESFIAAADREEGGLQALFDWIEDLDSTLPPDEHEDPADLDGDEDRDDDEDDDLDDDDEDDEDEDFDEDDEDEWSSSDDCVDDDDSAWDDD